MKKTILFLMACGSAQLALAASEQSCKLDTHDGKRYHARIVSAGDEYWIEARGAEETWTLRFDRSTGLYVFKDQALFDSINVYRSLRSDLAKMLRSVSDMQMYFNLSRWWQNNLTLAPAGTALGGALIDGLSVSISPQSRGAESSTYGLVFEPSKLRVDRKVSLQRQSVKAPLPLRFSFEALSQGESVEASWHKKNYAPARVSWRETSGKTNVLSCAKPRKGKTAKKPRVEKHADANEATRNFLQVVHAQGVMNVLKHLLAPTADNKPWLVDVLLTGICAKHLSAVYQQLESAQYDKTQLRSQGFMSVVGQEFGRAVASEFKLYRALLGVDREKARLINSYQNHCTDPLGLVMNNFSEPAPK